MSGILSAFFGGIRGGLWQHPAAPEARRCDDLQGNRMAAAKQLSFTGTAGELRERLATIEAQGATEVLFGTTGDDVPRELRAFAQLVGRQGRAVLMVQTGTGWALITPKVRSSATAMEPGGTSQVPATSCTEPLSGADGPPRRLFAMW